MRLLTWLVGVVVSILTALFAISNPIPVSITFWPFPFALDVGLYIIIIGTVFFGFLVGVLVTWIAAGKHRRWIRKQRSEIQALEGEITDLRTRLVSQETSEAA